MREGSLRTGDGRLLAYAERGPEGGAPVVVNHGTPGSRFSRCPLPSVYEELGIRAVCFDRPGYGRADPRPGRAVADVAEDVRALADELGLERFGVLGGSGGGPHALACAALLPERVTRTALLVPGGPSDDPELDFFGGMSESNVREFRAALESEAAFEEEVSGLVEALRGDPDAFFEALGDELPEADRRAFDRPEVRGAMKESLVEAVRVSTAGWREDDQAFCRPWGFRLEDVPGEVRVWHGELDVLAPQTHGRRIAERVPNGAFVLVPGAGHVLLDGWRDALRWLAAAPPDE